MEFNQLKNILEGALLASGTPMSMARLSALFPEEDNVSTGELGQALQGLEEDCEGRGVELVEVASGFRYQVREDVHPWVSRMWTERPSRYSRAQLETLALIAYRQPITRGEIEAVRGVSVSSNIIKTLEEREWIRVVGHRDVPGRPALFSTTREFLDYFKLKSLDELPSLAEIRDLDDLDPQLNLEDKNPPARAAMPEDPHATSAPQDGDAEIDSEVGADTETRVDTEDASEPAQATADDATDDTEDEPENQPRSQPQAIADEAKTEPEDENTSDAPNTEENRA